MRYSSSTTSQANPKSSRWGLIIIVGTLAVLLLILVAVVGIIFFTRQLSASRPGSTNLLVGAAPLTWLNQEEVDPALALASLGGVSEADVVSEAIDKVRPETALAALLFHPTITDNESAGGFIRLGAAYATAGQRDKAIFSYEMAGNIAALAPTMPDTVRADLFLQISEGFIVLEENGLAEFYLDQAFAVASKSPFLQAAHRRAILERLQKNYIIINNRLKARQSLSLAANAPNPTRLPDAQTILPANQPVPLPASVQEAEGNRWLAAQELAILLVERGGQAPPEAINALAEALIIEDKEKLAYYQAELGKTARVTKKIDITLAQIAWLSVKHRVARGAYGLSIAPAWEAEAEQIRANLTKTYESLFALYADLVVALPEASQIDKATEERLRREVLAGELGRYPNYPQEQRRKQLLDATAHLIATQPELNIFVSIGAVDNKELFTLISLE